MLPQRLHEQRVLLGVVARRQHVIGEVGPVESRDDRARISERELATDIFADFRCRRRGQRDGWRRSEFGARFSYTEIAWPEIVSPLADAVCFVDREQAHADAGKLRGDVSKIESFWREIKEPDFAARRACEAIRHLR